MAIYYIDPMCGNDNADGLSAASAKKDYRSLKVNAGDTVAFKRGSFMRDKLEAVAGEAGAPVTYTAYGEGDLPVFCGSTDVSATEDWEELDTNIWRCKVEISGEVGNIVFDKDRCEATLRWEREELCSQGDFWDSRFGLNENRSGDISPVQELLMYSYGNPAAVYRHIECASYNKRSLCDAKDHIVLENLSFINSGVHAVVGSCVDVVIRSCDFRNIGGCVFEKPIKVRFGNAVEFWDIGQDILIENCHFLNTYDSCITQQGPRGRTTPAKNFNCINNIFDTYSMAAIEYRDEVPINSAFENNVCRNAGCGFGMLGETPPRNWVLHPQPMGHHIFIWRMERACEGGDLRIMANIFENAPVGANIYSIISPEAEAQISLDNNTYINSGNLFAHFGGEDFSDLESYRAKTGKDKNSKAK